MKVTVTCKGQEMLRGFERKKQKIKITIKGLQINRRGLAFRNCFSASWDITWSMQVCVLGLWKPEKTRSKHKVKQLL